MDETQLMRQFCLFQKSWGTQTCHHGKGVQTTDAKKAGNYKDVKARTDSGLGFSKTDELNINNNNTNHNNSKSKLNGLGVLPPLEKCGISPLPVPPGSRSSSRRQNELNKTVVKHKGGVWPWREKAPKLSDNRNKHIEIHYSKIAPQDTWLEYKPRMFVSNPKYGSIYQIRKDVNNRKVSSPPDSTWLWENEYQLWRLDKRTNPPRSYSRRQLRHRNQKPGMLPDDKPHAELFAAYQAELLLKRQRQRSAVEIQRHVKGWLTRKHIKSLKHQVLVELGLSWRSFKKEYKETIVRIQSRYDVMGNSYRINLQQLQKFVDTRSKCELVFMKMADYGKLDKKQLPEFFQKCNLYPTEGDITKAFNTIFRGSQNTAEVVFVLDCSTSFGPVNFQHQINFIKDVVLGFEVAPDRIRVGVVPYNENVFYCFGLNKFKSREEVFEAVDQLEFKHGLTRTDLAIKMMRRIYQSARPGVQKLALVITDGKSPDPEKTRRQAQKARKENIEVFAVGVGNTVNTEQLAMIGGDADHVTTCASYANLAEFKNLVQKRICLASCTFCHYVLPRIQSHGFFKNEVLDIYWTLYPPLAADLDIDMALQSRTILIGSDQADGNPGVDNSSLVEACRPLNKQEVMEIIWMLYPPEATGLKVRSSRWIRPIVDGTEAWSLLDDDMLAATNNKQCLRLVIQAKLERDGVIEIPTDLKWGVERVFRLDEAMTKIESYLKQKNAQTNNDVQLQTEGGSLDNDLIPPVDANDKGLTNDLIARADANGGNLNNNSKARADANGGSLNNDLIIRADANGERLNTKQTTLVDLNTIADEKSRSQNSDELTNTSDPLESNLSNSFSNIRTKIQVPILHKPRRNLILKPLQERGVQFQTQPVRQILKIDRNESPDESTNAAKSLQILTINHQDNTEITTVKNCGNVSKNTTILKKDNDGFKNYDKAWGLTKQQTRWENMNTSQSDNYETDFNSVINKYDNKKTNYTPSIENVNNSDTDFNTKTLRSGYIETGYNASTGSSEPGYKAHTGSSEAGYNAHTAGSNDTDYNAHTGSSETGYNAHTAGSNDTDYNAHTGSSETGYNAHTGSSETGYNSLFSDSDNTHNMSGSNTNTTDSRPVGSVRKVHFRVDNSPPNYPNTAISHQTWIDQPLSENGGQTVDKPLTSESTENIPKWAFEENSYFS